MLEVVGRVDRDRQRIGGQDVREAERQLGAADPACKGENFSGHGRSL